MQKIEFVCSGNMGRSPLAELIARNHIARLDESGRLEATSSGTLVTTLNAWRDGSVPFNPVRAKWLLEQALKAGVYSGDERTLVRSFVRAEAVDITDPAVSAMTLKAQLSFDAEEMENRALVAVKLGLKGGFKAAPEQTVARRDAVVVLGMSSSNTASIREIYAPSKATPVIETLTDYTARAELAQVPDALGLGRDVYMEMAEVLRAETVKAGEKTLTSALRR